MKATQLLKIIGEVGDERVRELTQDGEPARLPRSRAWLKWGALAASLCLVGIAAIGLVSGWFGLFGARSGGGGTAGRHADGSTLFMAYAGPLFPLTVAQSDVPLRAKRQVSWDFSPFIGQSATQWRHETEVLDRYLLQNPTDAPLTVQAIYPYAGGVKDERPQVTVDGKAVSSQLSYGRYSGDFEPAWGGGKPGETLNLDRITSWDGYVSLLQSGDYRMEAMHGEKPDLDQTVVVYTVTDPVRPQSDAVNPTLAISFDLPDPEAVVLTYGFNGASFDYEQRHFRYSFSVPEKDGFGYSDKRLLIVVGGDWPGYELQGYRDGGCDEGEELDGIQATISRSETTLEAILHEIVADTAARFPAMYGDDNGVDLNQTALYTDLLGDALLRDGLLSGKSKMRYDGGDLESMISDVFSYDRVLYLSFPVTLPARAETAVEIRLTKEASLNYVGRDTKRYGFDLLTRLDTQLTFSELTAAVIHTESIEIVAQNMGFDLVSGVTQVALDPETEHYYLEVMRRDA